MSPDMAGFRANLGNAKSDVGAKLQPLVPTPNFPKVKDDAKDKMAHIGLGDNTILHAAIFRATTMYLLRFHEIDEDHLINDGHGECQLFGRDRCPLWSYTLPETQDFGTPISTPEIGDLKDIKGIVYSVHWGTNL